MARASIHIMNIDKKTYNEHISTMCSHINVGSGKDLTINELANIIKKVVGYEGTIDYDLTKPDGSNRKFLDNKKIKNLSFNPEVSLEEGLAITYQDYIKV